MKQRLLRFTLLAAVLAALSGCAGGGANPLTQDFANYGLNYDPFPTNQLEIGRSKNEVIALLGSNYRTVAASVDAEVVAYERWESTIGNDYVAETLLLQFQEGALSRWELANNVITVVPNGW